jgi:hypothetical protein
MAFAFGFLDFAFLLKLLIMHQLDGGILNDARDFVGSGLIRVLLEQSLLSACQRSHD